MLCALSLPVIEATDGGLKCLLRLMVKCSCNVKSRVVGHKQLRRKSAALWAAVVPCVPLVSAELVRWPGLLASVFLE